MNDSTTHTLAELAPLLCPNGNKGEVYKTARRIQNWVTARLLHPVGGAHSGRGVHRHFDRHELGKAAVLLELHGYQMPTKILELVADLFDDARKPNQDHEIKGMRGPSPGQVRMQQDLAKLLRRAWRGQNSVYLSLQVDSGGEIRADLGGKLALPKGFRSVVVVDLTEIISTLT